MGIKRLQYEVDLYGRKVIIWDKDLGCKLQEIDFGFVDVEILKNKGVYFTKEELKQIEIDKKKVEDLLK